MLSDEECEAVYAFLAQTMKTSGLDDVIAEVEQEIQDLESASHADIPPDLYKHDTASSRRLKAKAKGRPQVQASLPGLDANLPMQGIEELDPLMQRERIYTPQRRVLMLIDALEFAVVDPVEIGEVITRSLKQDKILFGDESQDEHAFLLSANDIAEHLEAARSLRTLLEELRQRIQGERI
jgi:hypothetical protein